MASTAKKVGWATAPAWGIWPCMIHFYRRLLLAHVQTHKFHAMDSYNQALEPRACLAIVAIHHE